MDDHERLARAVLARDRRDAAAERHFAAARRHRSVANDAATVARHLLDLGARHGDPGDPRLPRHVGAVLALARAAIADDRRARDAARAALEPTAEDRWAWEHAQAVLAEAEAVPADD